MPSNKLHRVRKFINPWDTAGKGVWIGFKEFLGYRFAIVRGFGVSVLNLDGYGNTKEVPSRIGKYEVIQCKVGVVGRIYTYYIT